LRILAAFFVHRGVALAAMLEEKLGELANVTTRHRIFRKPEALPVQRFEVPRRLGRPSAPAQTRQPQPSRPATEPAGAAAGRNKTGPTGRVCDFAWQGTGLSCKEPGYKVAWIERVCLYVKLLPIQDLAPRAPSSSN
jgi:hypothetical protein